MKKPEVLQLDFGFDVIPVVPQKNPADTHKKTADFVFDFMDCLTAPTIVFPSAWQDTIPKDLLSHIPIARLLCLNKGEMMASIPEMIAYMMPRTFESPLPSEWVNIYTWAGAQYAHRFKGADQQEVMAEIAPKELSEYEKGLLTNLRRWIYEKRRKALKHRMKSESQSQPKAKAPMQTGLFGDGP
ncbi:hypothetical protein [Flagellimonas pacifica]|uniref:Uncharacterized protein n=1 Tax=Flagellimonas pacifica TaxID=1247520 RepID=A0A285MS92_9FLAO|nr:hypothetical protein [Allomuricauda parva]SNY99553.1 hypothetical protein SAMN06265377_1364 [Allomuricauda parva]